MIHILIRVVQALKVYYKIVVRAWRDHLVRYDFF
jgi:hypothetical protein